jgi:glutathione synthase/RimK-type ligase-like ATP-grasp enzyme
MSIALLYERSETDEMGIKLTAQKLGVELAFIPFRKIAFSIFNNSYTAKTKGKFSIFNNSYTAKTKGKNFTKIIEDSDVILNRAQSKNRRLQAGYLLENLGKKTVNSSSIEFICYSKLRTLLHLWKERIPIPKTVFIPCDALETLKKGKFLHNEKDLANLFQEELVTNEGIIIKPDSATHGKGMLLSNNREELIFNIQKTKPSIINPIGIVAQEFIKKWFFDLRIIVYKEKGKNPVAHPTALARGGLKDFRTNTYLGNAVFATKLPSNIINLSIKSGKALAKGQEAWLFALDGMINIQEKKAIDDNQLKIELEKALVAFKPVQKIKAEKYKNKEFSSWNYKLEKSFQTYMFAKPYQKIKNIIDESIEKNKENIVFHEANSCPEFWEHTRLIAGINVAIPLINGAKSLLK